MGEKVRVPALLRLPISEASPSHQRSIQLGAWPPRSLDLHPTHHLRDKARCSVQLLRLVAARLRSYLEQFSVSASFWHRCYSSRFFVVRAINACGSPILLTWWRLPKPLAHVFLLTSPTVSAACVWASRSRATLKLYESEVQQSYYVEAWSVAPSRLAESLPSGYRLACFEECERACPFVCMGCRVEPIHKQSFGSSP